MKYDIKSTFVSQATAITLNFPLTEIKISNAKKSRSAADTLIFSLSLHE